MGPPVLARCKDQVDGPLSLKGAKAIALLLGLPTREPHSAPQRIAARLLDTD